MNLRFWGFVLLNFSGVVLLSALIVGPLFVAKNMAKVAGVKSESRYLVVSQIEKFPNLSLSQKENLYSIAFIKQGPSQAYLGVLIINNPTDTTQVYSIERMSGEAQPFFGENSNDQLIKVTVPTGASTAFSLFSGPEPSNESQTVEFRITAEGE